jgi:hypothetical protein
VTQLLGDRYDRTTGEALVCGQAGYLPGIRQFTVTELAEFFHDFPSLWLEADALLEQLSMLALAEFDGPLAATWHRHREQMRIAFGMAWPDDDEMLLRLAVEFFEMRPDHFRGDRRERRTAGGS